MILPIFFGFIAGKYVRKRNIAVVVGLTIGVVLGLLSGFEIAPLIYPLMVIQIPWVGIPEIRRIGLVFGHPDVVLFAESINFQSFSLVMMSILVVVSVIGAIIGIYLGSRYRGRDIDAPWESNNEPE